MSNLQKFEDLVAWQEAREYVKIIYSLTILPEINKDFRLIDQIRGAAISIMNNLAEGFERHHLKEKIQFYNIARGSCGESRSLLYVLEDSFPTLKTQIDSCMEQLLKTGKLITALIQSLQGKR